MIYQPPDISRPLLHQCIPMYHKPLLRQCITMYQNVSLQTYLRELHKSWLSSTRSLEPSTLRNGLVEQQGEDRWLSSWNPKKSSLLRRRTSCACKICQLYVSDGDTTDPHTFCGQAAAASAPLRLCSSHRSSSSSIPLPLSHPRALVRAVPALPFFSPQVAPAQPRRSGYPQSPLRPGSLRSRSGSAAHPLPHLGWWNGLRRRPSPQSHL